MNKFLFALGLSVIFSTAAFAWNPSMMDKQIDQTNFLLDIEQPKADIPKVSKDKMSEIPDKPATYLCSAILIDKKLGIMLTAAHCFSDEKATQRLVEQPGYDPDDNQHSFRILAIDTKMDLAVFKVDDGDLPNTDEASVACKSPTVRGSRVYAVGNPLGIFGVLSEGIIERSNIKDPDTKIPSTLISAPLSPGSSGGAIYNEDGQLIGVADAIIESRSNLNLMIPIEIVRKFLRGHKVSFIDDCSTAAAK